MQFRGGLGLAFSELNQPQPNALTPFLITLNAAVIGTCLAGCSTTATVTQPLPVGPDTYTVSARIQGSTASAREAAVSAANQQCARLAKQLLVLKSSTNVDFNENKGVTVAENEDARVAENKDVVVVDVTFRCLAAGDPELLRPNRQPTPAR
jgi:hypothetical protein